MRRLRPALLGILIVGSIAAVAAFQAAAGSQPGAGASDRPAVRAAEIDKLLAMPPGERRTHLRSLTRDERQGLWLALKKAEAGHPGGSRADYQKPGRKIVARPERALRTKATGTITYDSGFPSTAFGADQFVGNRFDTHTGIPVVVSGTVSTIQALVVPGGGTEVPMVKLFPGGSAGFQLLGPQTTMGGAPLILSSFASASGLIDTVSFAGLGAHYTGSSFFVLFGDFSSSYIPVLGTETNLGQGHHARVGYTSGPSSTVTNITNLGSTLNAFVRATGNIVPVELMTFEID